MITDEMFIYQKIFLEGQMHKYPKDLKTLHLVFCTHLSHEVHELMDCVPWKFHRAQKALPRQELIEEAVDCAKLLMNILILHGIDPYEFQTMFLEKSLKVEKRILDEEKEYAAQSKREN